MTKKLVTLLFSLFIPIVYADVTYSLSNKTSTPHSAKQNKEQTQTTDLTQQLLSPLELPITKSPLQNNKQRNIGASNKEFPKAENSVGGVLPDLFNGAAGQERFGIRGDVIKSVNLKERGDIDGANIQFIFRK
ncbi:hypothetical protein [Entomomonas asaccharolytica]|uniref:Uncharacterized protein n=1 Tax=Entomomonas asaccharolytica TaxID=2785331 RepID=A0A974NEU6_9GAMM|nr:hypothetical protein [Entomomonas asaccharolytica]QQP85481.1 hypothetical protein JHT90_14075 [Entomomonas asaccharolytica]